MGPGTTMHVHLITMITTGTITGSRVLRMMDDYKEYVIHKQKEPIVI